MTEAELDRKKTWEAKVDSLAHHLCYEIGDKMDMWEQYRPDAEAFLIHQVLKEHYDNNFELPV